MKPVNTTFIQTDHTQTPSQKNQGNNVKIPSTHFIHHQVVGDNDSLFRAAYMGLSNQPGIEPEPTQVSALKQNLADYLDRNQEALADKAFFENTQGIHPLKEALLTQGQWNHSAGDLIAPLLAQVFGRTLAVLQTAQGQQAYAVHQVFTPENPDLPAAANNSDLPPIYLAHFGGSRYAYLELHNPNMAIQGIDPLLEQTQDSVANQRRGRKSKVSHAHKDEIALLWRDNPKWTHKQVIQAFSQRHPTINISNAVTTKLKHQHPALQGLTLGYSDTHKNYQASTKQAILDLWQQNPDWSERKIAKEFKKRNPGLNASKSAARTLKLNNPSFKQIPASTANHKKLTTAQEDALAHLWRENPKWGALKITSEFKKRNPELTMSYGVPRALKTKHPLLKDLKIGGELSMKKPYPTEEQVISSTSSSSSSSSLTNSTETIKSLTQASTQETSPQQPPLNGFDEQHSWLRDPMLMDSLSELDDLPNATDIDDIFNEDLGQSPIDMLELMAIENLSIARDQQMPANTKHNPLNLADTPSASALEDLLSPNSEYNTSPRESADTIFDQLDDLPSAQDLTLKNLR